MKRRRPNPTDVEGLASVFREHDVRAALRNSCLPGHLYDVSQIAGVVQHERLADVAATLHQLGRDVVRWETDTIFRYVEQVES